MKRRKTKVSHLFTYSFFAIQLNASAIMKKVFGLILLFVAMFALGMLISVLFKQPAEAPEMQSFRGPTGEPFVKGPTENPPGM